MAYADKVKNAKYINEFMRDNYDRIAVMRPKGDRDKLKALAKEQGTNLNKFINGIIDAYLKDNNLLLTDKETLE